MSKLKDITALLKVLFDGFGVFEAMVVVISIIFLAAFIDVAFFLTFRSLVSLSKQSKA